MDMPKPKPRCDMLGMIPGIPQNAARAVLQKFDARLFTEVLGLDEANIE